MTAVMERDVTPEAATPKRIDRTAARRQAEFRARKALTTNSADELVQALIEACDRSGCSRFVDNLPDERQARIAELISRLNGAKLVACDRTKGKKKS